MLGKLKFYTRLGLQLIQKDIVNKEDYKNEYNKVSVTYDRWLKEMGKFTDRIINLDYTPKKGGLKILDFACGTGYISKNIIEQCRDCQITAVDYSNKMLEKLSNLGDSRIKTVSSDGIEFLKSTKEKYDIIYIGWGLPYFDYKELFPLLKRVLKPEGIIKVIANIHGTLYGIEDMFIKIMYENQSQVLKPMDIKFNLAKGSRGLGRWFNSYGFKELEVGEDELIVRFDSPEELLNWLNETGAVAGTSAIFKDYKQVEDDLIKEIKKSKYKDGKYEINHKFAYGSYKLK